MSYKIRIDNDEKQSLNFLLVNYLIYGVFGMGRQS